MASYSQGGGFYTASMRTQDHGTADQKASANGGEARHAHSTRFFPDAQNSSGNAHKRSKRPGRAVPRGFRSGPRMGVLAFLVLFIVSITIIGGDHVFSIMRNHRGGHGSFHSQDLFENQDGSTLFSFWNRRTQPVISRKVPTNWKGDLDDESYELEKKERGLHFGKAFVGKEELVDRDSRYWDKDDRVRDKDLDYDNGGLGTANVNYDSRRQNLREDLFTTDQGRNTNDDSRQRNLRDDFSTTEQESKTNSRRRKEFDDANFSERYALHDRHWESDSKTKQGASWKRTASGSGGLYNEGGRKELRRYEEELEAALKQELDSSKSKGGPGIREHEESMYNIKNNDKGIAISANAYQFNQTESEGVEDSYLEDGDDDYTDAEDAEAALREDGDHVEEFEEGNDSSDSRGTDDSVGVKVTSKGRNGVHAKERGNRRNEKEEPQQPSRKTTRRRRAGKPCGIDFLETSQGLEEPETALRFHNFSLTYMDVESPRGISGWEPRFAGHQTLVQRNHSFKAEDQTLHCGFVQAEKSTKSSGFDLTENDVQYLRTCKIAVSSCIFGSSDNVRSPRNRKLTGSFKKDVCFVMFVDQSTVDVMQQEGQQLDAKGFLGPWKVVVVKNLPYKDARRVGKIPKFLTHRLFPAARYSIWLDSKLRLQIDPVLILEYFLWRGGYEYAISNHYDRHCVWEEVQQNKKLNKYNHTAIDEQFALYQADGLTRFNTSDPKKLLPSNVPEGSFIVRAHTPMSNLFSCLWFNEVDRFTSRDQLSFAYTYMKFVKTNRDKHFHFNMFKDCERKSIAKLFRHRKNNSSSLVRQGINQ